MANKAHIFHHMSGLLFLLEVIAFVVVGTWAYTAGGGAPGSDTTGLLGMKSADDSRRKRAPPRWKSGPVMRSAAEHSPTADPPDRIVL
jgi:hypothetical protein